MTDPSEQALPFSEAAREAAALAFLQARGASPESSYTIMRPTDAALAAAVDADPRAKAFLKLAALTDEELRQRVEDALVKHAHESRRPKAVAILAALGLPVAEQETRG